MRLPNVVVREDAGGRFGIGRAVAVRLDGGGWGGSDGKDNGSDR